MTMDRFAEAPAPEAPRRPCGYPFANGDRCMQPMNVCPGHGSPKPGDKFDQGKARYDLLPFKALEEVVLVLTFGANKYKADGWREVENWHSRYFAAALRHLVAYFLKQEKRDPESGLHHLAHAACCVLFMLELDA